MHNRKVVKI